MRAGQGESCLAVVERRRLPGRRIVADVAGLREAGCHVIGTRSLLEVGQVASRALQRQCREVVVHVAQRTLRGDMGSR